MSGKLLIEWRRRVIKDVAVKRYIPSQDSMRTTHMELANIFFNEFCDDENSESEDEPGKTLGCWKCPDNFIVFCLFSPASFRYKRDSLPVHAAQ